MNNLKLIREIYGVTQDEISTAINVNRATISTWENSDDKKASNANLEKLSLYYGIGLLAKCLYKVPNAKKNQKPKMTHIITKQKNFINCYLA